MKGFRAAGAWARVMFWLLVSIYVGWQERRALKSSIWVNKKLLAAQVNWNAIKRS